MYLMRIANEHVGDVFGERLVDVPIQQLLQDRLIVLQFVIPLCAMHPPLTCRGMSLYPSLQG